MRKACSRCGRIHDYGYKCRHGKRPGTAYASKDEVMQESRELRNTWQWHKKSMEIRERANYLCEACKDKGRYTYTGLEVHHITKVRDAPSELLLDSNLVCLCTSCHKAADRGDIDPDYLRALARRRDGGI